MPKMRRRRSEGETTGESALAAAHQAMAWPAVDLKLVSDKKPWHSPRFFRFVHRTVMFMRYDHVIPHLRLETVVMKRQTIVALAAGAAVIGSATVALAYPGQELASQAHASLAQARSIATHAVKGTIVDQELEKEAGGSRLRYSFDLKTANGLREVGVDANTGAMLENSADNGNDEQAGTEQSGRETGEGTEKPGGEGGESDNG